MACFRIRVLYPNGQPTRDLIFVFDLRMCELLLKAGADPTIRGWMQVDAVLEAQLACKADPTSQVRLRILSLVSKSK